MDTDDPLSLFAAWMEEADKTEPADPTACALATVDSRGHPDVRMILLRGSTKNPFVFYTNLASAKGRALTHCPRAALCLYWKSVRRQVRVRGFVDLVSQEQADTYFCQRHRGSQIGAWASEQSRPIPTPKTLQARFADAQARFEGTPVLRPPYWSGYHLTPLHLEFWEHRPDRLHHRRLFTRQNQKTPWKSQVLYP